ncbi:MAG: hypothetical protein BGO98_07500 [Myxococcales bacterium 68-20]|nr:MAG: hypothetical protein BGO98_07500 [Myxococcales bacterium 68-20]
MEEKKASGVETMEADERDEASMVRQTSAASRASRPPVVPRRDPRADPDDEPISGRIDVVTVDRGERQGASVDVLTNAALTLRRELAKLHQQAAAVERTIEDQRRERSETFERIELANSRAQDLEHKLTLAEAEVVNVRRLHDTTLDDLQRIRSERDDLSRAIESAKSATDELARMRAEAEALRKARDEALEATSTREAELAEIRKREQTEAQKVSDSETELGSLRERVERTSAELARSREEAAQSKAEAVRLRQEAADAADAEAKTLAKAERERNTAREDVERLEKMLAEARAETEKLVVIEAALAMAQTEAADARAEIGRLEREVESARHARDVSVERTMMVERELDDVRQEAERLQREIEAQTIASANANTRAIAAERARSFVEDSVKQLRDEVTAAFARWRSVAPSTPPSSVGSVAPPTRFVPSSSREPSEAPPMTRRAPTSFPPLMAEARPLSMPAPPPLPNATVDEGWTTGSEPPPAPERASADADAPSRSVAPPPPRAEHTMQSIPPAVYPSTPPPAGSAPTMPPPAVSVRSPEAPSSIHILSTERDDLLERLGDDESVHDAATKLLERPDWLRGRPPLELLLALTHLDYDVEAPVFEVARTWEREPLCRALIAALRDEPDPKLREHGAWLLKYLGAPSAWPVLAELVTNETEPSMVRRWLLEAIERLVATRGIGWREVGDLVAQLLRHPDASLRDGTVSIIAALERSDEKRRALLDILRTDDDEIVLSSAVHALTSALPIELDPAVAERLLGHPSARVQSSVVDFIERSKRTAAKS